MGRPGRIPAVEVAGLAKSFARREALRGVSFTVEPGTVFGVIGPNGAGKTTLLRCLLDIIRPSAVRLRVLGHDPRTGGPALRRRMGYLPGELVLEDRTSGRRLLEHYAAISGAVPPGRVEELAERLGLDLDRHVGRLSKGNKQKLGLVQAFAHDPELLVLDEPTGGLDPLVQQEFLGMVREARDRGRTVLLSSHVLSEIQQVADQVALLRAGALTTVSSVHALRENAVRHLRFTTGAVPGEDLEQWLRTVPGLSGVTATRVPGGVAVSARLAGAVQPLVRALAAVELTDLVLEEPDLEEAVLGLYTAPARAVQEAHRA